MESESSKKSWKEYAQEYKSHIIVAVCALLLGVLLGTNFFKPQKDIEYKEKVEVKEVVKTEYKDRIVEKVVFKENIKKNEVVRTITKYIERPDGTKEQTIEQVSETKEEKQTQSEASKEQQTEVKQEAVVETKIEKEYSEKVAQKNWHVGATAGLTPLMAPVYGGQVERRILGPFFLGLRADTAPSASVVVGFEF